MFLNWLKFVMQMLQSSSLIKNSSNKADLHVKFRFFLLNFLIAWVKNENGQKFRD